MLWHVRFKFTRYVRICFCLSLGTVIFLTRAPTYSSRTTPTQHNGIREDEYISAFLATLNTLRPRRIIEGHQTFRRILAREYVGISWDAIPENYFTEAVLPRISSGVTILDIGANSGKFAIPILEKGVHQVVLFEPNIQVCGRLKSNLEERQYGYKVRPAKQEIPFRTSAYQGLFNLLAATKRSSVTLVKGNLFFSRKPKFFKNQLSSDQILSITTNQK